MDERPPFLFTFFHQVQRELNIHLSIEQYASFCKVIQAQEGKAPNLQRILNICKLLWLPKIDPASVHKFEELFHHAMRSELSLDESPTEPPIPTLGEYSIADSVIAGNTNNEEVNKSKTSTTTQEGTKENKRTQSVYLNYREDPNGHTSSATMQSSESRSIFSFRTAELPLRGRVLHQKLQYLSVSQSHRKSTEIDIPRSVWQYSRNLALVEPIWRQEKLKTLNIAIFVDQYGSMTPFEFFHQQLIKNLHESSAKLTKAIQTYYFHNYIEDRVFAKSGLYGSVELNTILKKRPAKIDLFIIISDAGALNEDVSFPRINQMFRVRELFREHNPKSKVLWFNPLPSSRWKSNSSVGMISHFYTMLGADKASWQRLPSIVKAAAQQKRLDFVVNDPPNSSPNPGTIPPLDDRILEAVPQLKVQLNYFLAHEAKQTPELFWFAAHAAYFPMLTPNLLHQLWLNFADGIAKKLELSRPIPALVAADLLKSSLVRSVGLNSYQMHPALREVLLGALIKDDQFGAIKRKELASFLKAYFGKYHRSELYSSTIAKAVEMTYLMDLDPKRVYEELLSLLSKEGLNPDSAKKLDRIKPVINSYTLAGTANNPIGTLGRVLAFVGNNQEETSTELDELFSTITEDLSLIEQSDVSLYVKVSIGQEYFELLKRKKRLEDSMLTLKYGELVNEFISFINEKTAINPGLRRIYFELLFLFGYTKNEKIFGGIKSIDAQIFGTPPPSSYEINDINNYIQAEDLPFYNQLRVRYFPRMILVPGAASNEGNSRDQQAIKPFSMAETPITWWQFNVFLMADRQALDFKDWWEIQGNHPAVNVSWSRAEDYIKWLNSVESAKYALPLEAEWIYAAQSGGQENYRYAGGNNLDELGWYKDNSQGSNEKRQTNPVKQKQPNKIGLYDLSGNVWEWCQDNAYALPAQKVLKGGAWNTSKEPCEIKHKNSQDVYIEQYAIGFRVIQRS